MSSIRHNRWDCSQCGTNQGHNSMWFVGDICEACNEEKLQANKKVHVNDMLIHMWGSIGIDKPSNHDAILEFVYEDVHETAHPTRWHSGDVAIAFRRWIEDQANKSYPCSGGD